MRPRKTLITALYAALILSLAQATIAQGGGQELGPSPSVNRCFLEGTAWVGNAVGFAPFTITFQAGVNPHRFGSMDLELIDPEVTLGGFFPTASSGTDPIGVWRRTGRRKFAWNWLMHVFNEDGEVVYLLKPGGTIQLSKDCLKADITADLDLYAPDQDPLGEEPPAFGCVPFPGAITMARMEVVKPSCAE